ncbi:RNaseH domain-containing protein [Mesorhizobium sp.]|uniref:RNaseH domain-containing protein n=1 Tax=Mesorhizobium sp. TaxID=1871066 RepID=UPI0025DB7D16|nr:RNaseH domain-containing protein [Mesorhizobium sp.]
MFFRRKPGSESESIQVLGLSVVPGATEPIECVRVSWTPQAADAFLAISAAARATDPGNRLPYSTLRALLSAGLPDPLYVASDLALIGQAERETGRPPFAECAGGEEACVRAANLAVRSWATNVLGPWAQARGIQSGLVSEVTSLALGGSIARAERKIVDLIAPDPLANGFPDIRDAIHAAAFRRIAGTELFAGMGPVRALVRSHARDNAISFITFPRRVPSGSWSMRARLAVETSPGLPQPFVRIEVSRMRWCPEIPTNLMPRQRRISAAVFGIDERRAISFDVPVHRGTVQNPEDPAYALSALRAGIDPGEGFASLVSIGPRDGAFVGIPYAPAYKPAPSVATGATELDWLDCHDAVARAMSGILEPLTGISVPAAKRVARTSEDIPALKAANILSDVARALGHNEIDDEAIADAWEMLHGGALPRGVSISPKADDEARRFDELRASNTERLRQTFGTEVPTIVVLSADAREGAAIADVIGTLFDGRMHIEHRLLPQGVHGSRNSLAAAGRPARERYENRVSIWRPFAEHLLKEHGPCRILVHASRFRDDPVNKIAGRIALARYGDSNVQYLDARGAKADEWFFRIQAAVLDLMFGHSGLVSPVARNVSEAFPEAAARPRSIIGISVVSQNRTFSRSAASFFLSVSIDVASGRTSATAARPKDGTLDFAGPLPFYDLLKAVAAWDGASVGSGETAMQDFQEFVEEVVGNACERGENPLVLFDGTHARNLWRLISNKGWGGPYTLRGRPLDPAVDWPGARIVRVQDMIEPNVVTRKSRTFVQIDQTTGSEIESVVQSTPTLTEAGRLVRLPGTAPNYVSSGDHDGQQKIAKGLSVYRTPPQFKLVAADDLPTSLSDEKLYSPAVRDLTEEPYKLPGTIGILVAHCLPSDDPDRIAALCHGLRTGFGHTRSPVKMPAPLFQTRKVAEYIPAYILDEQEDEDEAVDAAEPVEEDSSDEPTPVSQPSEEDDEESAKPANHDASSSPSTNRSKPSTLDADEIASPVRSAVHALESEAIRASNPLFILSKAVAPLSLDRAADISSRPVPASGTALPTIARKGIALAPSLAIPAEIRNLAAGDTLLEELLEMCWVGPLPSFMSEAWLLPLVSAHAAPRTRQQVKDAVGKSHLPLCRFLPEFDPKSETSFAHFMLGLMHLADGIGFLWKFIPRTMGRNSKRWIFNPVYDQLFRDVRSVRKFDAAESLPYTLAHSPLQIGRSLHLAGHGNSMRHYLALESLFMPKHSSTFAETAAKLLDEFGSEYADVAAFCARAAACQARAEEVRARIDDYAKREGSKKDLRKLGRADMTDVEEVIDLPHIPKAPAPGVDAGWLRDKISLSGAFRSHLHAHRSLIRQALSDPGAWPDDKPSTEAITACVARLFSVPEPVLAAIDLKDKESLFRPFYRKIESTLRAIEESRPAGALPSLSANWVLSSEAPSVFAFLSRGGYRNYAAEFALVRAVDNPSLGLEQAVTQAGEEFDEVAKYVSARRKATLWFAANDERAEDELFAGYLAAFDEGEASLPAEQTLEGDMDERNDGEENEGVVIEAMTHHGRFDSSPRKIQPETDITPLQLSEVLKGIEDEARQTRNALNDNTFLELDGALERIGELLAQALKAAARTPRLVENSVLLQRAATLGREATLISEHLGESISMPALPPQGRIRTRDAGVAEGHLRAGEAAAEAAHDALREAGQLQAEAMTAKLLERASIYEAAQQRIQDVQFSLETVVRSFSEAISLLNPGAPPAALRSVVPAAEGPNDGVSSPREAAPLPEKTAMVSGVAVESPLSETGVDLTALAKGLGTVDSVSSSEEPETSLAADAEPLVYDELAAAADDSDAEDTLDEDDESDQLSLSELASAVAAIEEKAPQQVPAPLARMGSGLGSVAGDFEDLEATRIDEALERLMTAGSYSLAYNLALASEKALASNEGNSPRRFCVTSDEAKLAALSGHLNHTALQSNIELVNDWIQAGFRSIDTIASDPHTERAAARLITLMPLLLELGIFFPSLGAAELLRSFGSLPGDLGTHAQEVFESIERIQHTNLTFSRAMLANVQNELDCSKALADTRAALLKKAAAFQSIKFDFQLGNKIRNELNRGDSLVGSLRLQLQKGLDDTRTAEMVRNFVDRVKDRSRILQLFEEIESAVNNRIQGLDGVARNRLVAFFESFRDIASNYIELTSEVEQAKNAERPKGREFAMQIARSLEGMIAAVDAAASDLGRVSIAASHVGPRLRKLAAILSGELGMSVAPGTDIYQSCHAELALITELEFGRSWLPTPYEPSRIVDILCEIEPPLLSTDTATRDETFEDAVRARMERNSYVGARMLLDAASFFGIDEELTAALAGEFETSVADAKEALKDDFDRVRRIVERVIRFGSLRQGSDAEEATALLDRIDKLEAMQVPAIVGPGDRTEQEADGIYDVSVAIDETEAIKAEAQALLDEPRIRLEGRIDRLPATADRQLRDRLRQLCQSDDLLTAEEHIDEVEKTGRLSESRRRNWRFDAFSEVLHALVDHRRDLPQQVASALRGGTDFAGMRFSQLTDARREESADIADIWRDLFRRFHDTSFSAHLSSFLDKLGISAEIKHLSGPAGGQRRTFVGDFRVKIPTDQESLLLPDFGSRTEGTYRLVVVQTMPPDSVISEHCSQGKLGVILFVNDVVSPDQRRNFLLRNIAAHRRVLLVDSATLFYALAEPSIRALTLIELAQPYSYVAPYKDWGRDAVPPEMFVGREDDIAQIFDSEGSNIVYGGRRMGKTAILRHLVTIRNAPEKGTLVAFVDAQDIGRGNTATKVVWSEIATALPDIFGASPTPEPKRVREAIRNWLDEDDRRRVLLLLDECDHFVVSDAAQGYREFRDLQQLMTDTRRRFKFVLAGLSDVTRLVQTGNPPLKQISANPRRIGSLTGEERKDAEDLVLRPFAALGLELERTDVWRILSHANYYPVLIQTYAQRLLQAVMDHVKSSQKPMRKVPTGLVSEVMEDLATRSEIKKIFEFTLGIDLRYRLIAYVVANLVFQAEAEGRLEEGFPTHEIRDQAIYFWEAGFHDRNRFSLFDDLLDEMEGLGIVRRVGGDRWTLRSTAVVRLLGNRDEIDTALLEFAHRDAPVGFDPKSHRRILAPAKNVLSERRPSPLTLGQERDVLLSKARATVIVGNKLADYPLVAWALKSVPDSFSDGESYDVRLLSVSSLAELDATLRDQKVAQGRKLIAIVQASAPWTAEWVRSAINVKTVARGDVRVVFVGGPEHASSVIGDGQLAALTSHVDVVPLEPWSTAFFTDMVNKDNVVSLSTHFEAAATSNGGWNQPMSQLFAGGQKGSARVQPDPIDAEAIGLTGRYGKALAMLARLHGPSSLSLADIEEYIGLDEELSSLGVSAQAVVDYGVTMGLLVAAPGKPAGERARGRYMPSPLVAQVLGLAPAAASK